MLPPVNGFYLACRTARWTFKLSLFYYLVKKTNNVDTFFSGGSIANFYGMSLGRYHQFPQVKTEGMHGIPRLIVLTSEHVSVFCREGSGLCGGGGFGLAIL